MSDFLRFQVNGREYSCGKLNPIDAIDFCLSAGEVLSNGEAALMTSAAKPIIIKALKCCYNSQNQSLSDEVAFNNQFIKYPEDIFPLAFQAIRGLTEDFFPSTPNIPQPPLPEPTKDKA
jgi:hypothetical protein